MTPTFKVACAAAVTSDMMRDACIREEKLFIIKEVGCLDLIWQTGHDVI